MKPERIFYQVRNLSNDDKNDHNSSLYTIYNQISWHDLSSSFFLILPSIRFLIVNLILSLKIYVSPSWQRALHIINLCPVASIFDFICVRSQVPLSREEWWVCFSCWWSTVLPCRDRSLSPRRVWWHLDTALGFLAAICWERGWRILDPLAKSKWGKHQCWGRKGFSVACTPLAQPYP